MEGQKSVVTKVILETEQLLSKIYYKEYKYLGIYG